MKKILVEISGDKLLMNSPLSMLFPKEALKSKTKAYDPVIEAEKLAYRMKDGYLYIPSTAIKGTLLNASSYKKAGKYALKPIIASAVRIEPEQISLGTKKYELDIRTVVIQRSRVPKARPVLKDWKAKFTLIYDEDMIPSGDVELRPILEEAGKRVGILDYRPQKSGDFGVFTVTKWLPENK